MFKTYDELVAFINSFDGIKYGKTRNYINGGVSRLSPYITHGVITTKEVITLFLQRYTVQQAEMLFKELLWREYFVQVHYRKRDGIFSDMEEDKTNIRKHDLLPSSLLNKTTQSKWVNQAILELEQT
jgi:deoxyribodipyrimidine photo-lyase